jgi:ribosomal protein S18 acetylase RimI-like enzyme
MDNFIDIEKVRVLSIGILPKRREKYALVLQSQENIDAILSLQDQVYAGLSQQERAYLLPKDRAFFEKHFLSGNIVLGVVHNNQLIAQSIIVNPTDENPKSGMTDLHMKQVRPQDMSVLQGVVVDPNFRGNGLMSIMVAAWTVAAAQMGRKSAVAEVAAGNHYSWAVFLKEGLCIQSIGEDKSDNTVLYNLYAPVKLLMKRILKADFNKAAVRRGVRVSVSDLEQQQKFLLEGYKGIALDAGGQSIVFRRVVKGGERPASGAGTF